MRDNLMGGVLVTAVASPVLIVCCGDGGVLLAGILGAINVWLSKFAGISVLLAAAAVVLTWHTIRRCKQSDSCCVQLTNRKATLGG